MPLPEISDVMSTVLNAPAVSAPELAATVEDTDGAFEYVMELSLQVVFVTFWTRNPVLCPAFA